LEALIGKPSCNAAVGAVYSGFLARILCGFPNPRDRSHELRIKLALDGMADVVPEIPRPHEQDVNAVDFRNLLYLHGMWLAQSLTDMGGMSHTFSRALLVSIWTTVNRLSLAFVM